MGTKEKFAFNIFVLSSCLVEDLLDKDFAVR